MKYATFPYDTVELENGHLDFTFKVGIRIPVAIFSAQIRFVSRFSKARFPPFYFPAAGEKL